jgi:hypothetical protein
MPIDIDCHDSTGGGSGSVDLLSQEVSAMTSRRNITLPRNFDLSVLVMGFSLSTCSQIGALPAGNPQDKEATGTSQNVN